MCLSLSPTFFSQSSFPTIFFIDLKSLSTISTLFFYVKLFNKYLKLSLGVLVLMKDFSSFRVVFVGFYS